MHLATHICQLCKEPVHVFQLPAEHRVEVVGRAAPLEVPPCTSEIDFRPVVVGEFDSIVTSGFSSVSNILGRVSLGL